MSQEPQILTQQVLKSGPSPSTNQIQNTKTQPVCPQHNIYTNKCMDICIPSCEYGPFPKPPSAKLKTLPIVINRSDLGPYTLS
jgi:hypothetical protein